MSPVTNSRRSRADSDAMSNGKTMTTSALRVLPNSIQMNPMRQLGLLIQWELRRMLTMLPLVIVIQGFTSVMTLLGYGMLLGEVPDVVANYLVTGATSINLIILGLVMVPQAVAQSKTEGSLDWMRTLPLPRWAFLVADLVVYVVIALPGIVLAPIVGVLRYGVTLSISVWIFLVAPVVALIASTVGYSLALVLQPRIAHLLSQVLVFVTLMFSPLSYPSANMPGWLQEVHHWLPLEPMGEAIRATLMSEVFEMPTRSIVVLAAWTGVALCGAMRALSKRN